MHASTVGSPSFARPSGRATRDPNNGFPTGAAGWIGKIPAHVREKQRGARRLRGRLLLPTNHPRAAALLTTFLSTPGGNGQIRNGAAELITSRVRGDKKGLALLAPTRRPAGERRRNGRHHLETEDRSCSEKSSSHGDGASNKKSEHSMRSLGRCYVL